MADDDGKIGILGALWRWATFYNRRKGRAILRSAYNQYTGSPSGIADAFDETRDEIVGVYKELRDAVSQVEAQAETKRQQLEDLNNEEQEQIEQREGALAMAEKAKDAGDTAEYDRHSSAYARFDARINQIEERQARLETEIKGLDESMKKHLLRLTELQAKIDSLPQEKAEQMSDFVSSKAIIELNDRMQGLQTSMDMGAIDAVRKANRELSAKARISEKLAGTDVKLQDAEYKAAGRVSTSRDKLEERIAARKAERDVKAGVTPAAPVAEKKAEVRQNI